MALCPHCSQTHPEDMNFCPWTGRPIVDITERMIGRTIMGKYQLVQCIGQGGMGTIFEAKHVLIGNRVAVKLLHETFATSQGTVQRLYREARVTGSIGHPNIIQIFDVGETKEGTPFLVMELLKGESFGDHLEKHGPRPVDFVLDVGIQMLSALHAAHAAGVMHRDLKSDNVFLLDSKDDHQVRVKLLDFGVSKFIAPEKDKLKLTQTGSVIGTPYYMSPEQASGMKDLDHRIDIYAAGVIMYEAIIGSVPHMASNYNALLMDIITNDVRSFAWQRPDVSKDLEAVILTAMSRDRRKRWQRADDFMKSLAEIRKHLSIQQISDPLESMPDTLPRVVRDDRAFELNKTTPNKIQDTPFFNESSYAELDSSVDAVTWRRRVVVLGGVLVSLLACIAVVFFVLFSPRDEVSDKKLEPNAVSTRGVPQVKLYAAQVHVDDPGGTPDEIPDSIQLKVKQMPAEAKITVNGRPVPPEGIKLKKGSTPLPLVAEASGYKVLQMKIIPLEDIDLKVKLVPLSVGSERLTTDRSQKRRRARKSRHVQESNGKEEASNTNKEERLKEHSMDRPMDNPF
ncbi:MAG: serine/threonine protein kinase [Proteobacteria bacterium]|nr:serine/threonine protein kinase [Pseudomonadota bacterium]